METGGGLGWQGENDDGGKVRDGNRVTMKQKRSDVGRQQEGPDRAFQLGDKTKWPSQRESVPVRHFSSHASLLYTSSTKGIWRAWIITEFLRRNCFQKHVMQVQCLFINPLWVDCFCSIKKSTSWNNERHKPPHLPSNCWVISIRLKEMVLLLQMSWRQHICFHYLLIYLTLNFFLSPDNHCYKNNAPG